MKLPKTLTTTVPGFTAGVLGAFLVFWLHAPQSSGAQEPPPSIVMATEYRVVDDRGQVRTVLNTDGIAVFDEFQRPRLQLRGDSPGLYIFDEQGQTRAELFLYPGGESHLYLHDREGQLRTVVDESELAFVSPSRTELVLSQAIGAVSRLLLSTSDPSGPGILMAASEGKVFCELGAAVKPADQPESDSPEGRLVFYDDKKQVVWSAPPASQNTKNNQR